jgi:hypothetical protein
MIEEFESRCELNRYEITANTESIKYIDDSEEIAESSIIIYEEQTNEDAHKYSKFNNIDINCYDKSHRKITLNPNLKSRKDRGHLGKLNEKLCDPNLNFWQIDQNIQETLEKLDELI